MAKTAPQPELTLVTVTLVDPVEHDGQPYAPGAELRLPAEQAQALIALGAAASPAGDAAAA